MTRHLLSLAAGVVLAAVVGAQSPRALRPEHRGELYAMNQKVIERLVDRTIESARSPNDHLKRADSYFQVLGEFYGQIRDARDRGDSDRVSELTRHVLTLVDKGLAPSLVKAKRQVEGGSGQEEFPKVRANLLEQLKSLLEIVGDEPAARATLEAARSKVNAINLPARN